MLVPRAAEEINDSIRQCIVNEKRTNHHIQRVFPYDGKIAGLISCNRAMDGRAVFASSNR